MRQKFLRFLHEHPLWSLGILLFLGMALILWHTFSTSLHIQQQMAKQYAALYITALKETRAFYTTNVVDRLKERGVKVSHDYLHETGAIPLPATLSIELAQQITATRSGIMTRLYSDYPFPFRQNGGPHDPYEVEALIRLRVSHEQSTEFARFEQVEGRWSLRYAKGVFMEQPCVDCHNSRTDSPKRDWKVGDMRGVQEVIIPMDTSMKTLYLGGVQTLSLMSLIMFAGIGVLAIALKALRTSLHDLSMINTALRRFVPHEFLQFLQKKSIVDVQLTDNVQREMTILFSDIRSFTALSEKMTPEENFRFINTYMGHMGPIVRQHHGYIDKYIGDAIMALFDRVDDAVDASIAMLHQLAEYNRMTPNSPHPPIRIGIGLNTGKLMLGTIGEQHRMEGTVISDAVNIASRMESLTKVYGVPLLISEHTYRRLYDTERFFVRLIDRVKVKGKTEPIIVYEVFNGDPADVIEKKLAIRQDFEHAVKLYQVKRFAEARHLFEACLQRYEDDSATQFYIARCKHFLAAG